MSASAELQPAFVLHTRAYRDTSLLVDLWTRDAGRIGAVARGVRQRKGGLRPLLNPFVPLLASWRGRTSLKTLTGAEANGRALRLQGQRLYSGLYVNELLVRLLPEGDPHPALYQRYLHSLEQLQSEEALLEPLLRRFELCLLAELGYAPDLHRDVTGEPLQAGRLYRLEPHEGFVPVTVQRQAQNVFAGAQLLAVATGDFAASDAAASAKRLTRILLAPLLGSRPLKSRELFVSGSR